MSTARRPLARRVRLYRALRTAHLERAHQLDPASIVFVERRYDFDDQVVDGLHVVQASPIGAAALVARQPIDVLEVNEPLMTSSLSMTALAVMTVRARDRLRRRRATVVTYAIANSDPWPAAPGTALPTRVRHGIEHILPPGVELVGGSADPGEATIRSATLDGSLPPVSAVLTEPVDLSGQTQSFTTVARLVAPAGTSLAQTSVEVTVTIREVSAEKVFGAVPIAVQNAPEGWEVTLSQPTAEVRLTGRYTLVHPLDASAVMAYVDVQGLGPGTHRLPVKVVYPPEIVETAIDPAMVEVTISLPEIE